MRAVTYARYSTDLQRTASIDDRTRVCRERIERDGWTYLHAYHDRAMSGTSHLRPGYQKLLDEAQRPERGQLPSQARRSCAHPPLRRTR
jgi:site-specific DNA recombinase